MEHHKKQFENVFSTDKKQSITKLNFDKITIADGMSVDQYILDFRAFLNKAFLSEFDIYVRLSWYRRLFRYHGNKAKASLGNNSWQYNLGFVKLMRRCIGKDIQIITRARFFSKIETYFEDFFPGFMEGNPITNPEYYKFPYKNISMEYLTVVHHLNDRSELLKEADERSMSYAVFIDYILNHIKSENLRLKRERYLVKHNQDRDFTFCVRDGDKDARRKYKLNKKK
jgi:hypothetical protein